MLEGFKDVYLNPRPDSGLGGLFKCCEFTRERHGQGLALVRLEKPPYVPTVIPTVGPMNHQGSPLTFAVWADWVDQGGDAGCSGGDGALHPKP